MSKPHTDAALESASMDPIRIVFVAGAGRSGTTLLQSMIAAHRDVVFLPETGFLRRLVIGGRLDAAYRKHGLSSVSELLERDERLEPIRRTFRSALEQSAHIGTFSSIALYRNVLSYFAAEVAPDRLIVGDKDPRLIEHVDFLATNFPRSTLIQIVRDPRDVLLSRKNAAWSKQHGLFRQLLAQTTQVLSGLRDAPRAFAGRYVSLRYEVLITQPESTLRMICGALDLPFDAGMLNFGATARRLARPDEEAWKANAMGALLSQNAGKWRSVLSPMEVALVEGCMKEVFDTGWYQRADLSLRRRAVAQPLSGLLRLAARSYHLTRGAARASGFRAHLRV